MDNSRKREEKDFKETQTMSRQVNEDDAGILELRRRNLKAAELLEQWMIEDADDDQTDWPILEQELRDGTLRCREPEDV
jgi:hypothetical protein